MICLSAFGLCRIGRSASVSQRGLGTEAGGTCVCNLEDILSISDPRAMLHVLRSLFKHGLLLSGPLYHAIA